jgi:hypothetical protein
VRQRERHGVGHGQDATRGEIGNLGIAGLGFVMYTMTSGVKRHWRGHWLEGTGLPPLDSPPLDSMGLNFHQ